MEIKQTFKSRILSLAGMLFFLIPPFIIFCVQVYIGIVPSNYYTKVERLTIMLSYLPDFLQHNSGVRAIFFFIFSMLSVVVGYFGVKPTNKFLKVIRIVAIVLGSLMALLCLLAIKKSYLTR
jgi:amino acid transporter